MKLLEEILDELLLIQSSKKAIDFEDKIAGLADKTKFVIDNFELAPKNPTTNVLKPFMTVSSVRHYEQTALGFYREWLSFVVKESSKEIQNNYQNNALN